MGTTTHGKGRGRKRGSLCEQWDTHGMFLLRRKNLGVKEKGDGT